VPVTRRRGNRGRARDDCSSGAASASRDSAVGICQRPCDNNRGQAAKRAEYVPFLVLASSPTPLFSSALHGLSLPQPFICPLTTRCLYVFCRLKKHSQKLRYVVHLFGVYRCNHRHDSESASGRVYPPVWVLPGRESVFVVSDYKPAKCGKPLPQHLFLPVQTCYIHDIYDMTTCYTLVSCSGCKHIGIVVPGVLVFRNAPSYSV
jgi:hypothetical protein